MRGNQLQITKDLITAFHEIGLPITMIDVPIVLRLGADRYLQTVRFEINAESLSALHILIHCLREELNKT